MKSYSFFSQHSTFILNEQEKKALDYIEHILKTNDADGLTKIINELIKYPGELLLKFYNMSYEFKDFFQKNIELHEAITTALKENNNLHLEINSMDKNEHISIFNLLIAVRLIDRYEDEEATHHIDNDESKIIKTWALDKSCEIGLYDALVTRCNENATQYLAEGLTDEEKSKLEEIILADLNRLCNLYWSIGYLKAGNLLREYANKLSEKKELIDKATYMYEEGIRKTLCASFLENNTYSQAIEKSLTNGKGYFANQDNPKWHNWDGYKEQLCQWSGSDANYQRLYNFAKQEIESLLKNQNESKPSLS